MAGPHDRTDPQPAPHPQTSAAHSWAAGFRARREELRRELAAGVLTLADVLDRADDTDDGAVKLLFVLESLPGAGKVATRRRLAQLDLPETAPIRSLTAEQRRTVLEEFPMPTGAAGRPGAAGGAGTVGGDVDARERAS